MDASPGREASSGLGASERRVLNPRPFRAVLRAVSASEAVAGAVVLVLLACVAAWVAWRGAHPDPARLADAALVTATGKPRAGVDANRRAPVVGESSGVAASRAEPERDVRPAPGGAPGRAGLPAGLAGDGWTEGPAERCDATNLWERIDGRADFFLARGFRSLTCVTLSGEAGATVDVELYDLGSTENALDALGAEKPPGATVKNAAGTPSYVVRNALFLARGSSYVRALGSDESPAVLARLERVRAAFAAGNVPAGEDGALAAPGSRGRG